MMSNEFDRIKSKYIFTVAESTSVLESYKSIVPLGSFYIGVTEATDIAVYQESDKELVVIGNIINLNTGSSDLHYLIKNSSTIDDLVKGEYELGGKYILVARFADEYFLLGDATTSIPIYYNIDKEVFCSFSDHDIAMHFNYTPDQLLMEVRNSGDISMAMPFDLTVYKEIKQLLPNHYLSLNNKTAIRFVNADKKQKLCNSSKIAYNTVKRVETLTKYYCDNYSPLCPITSGRDSRAVLAFLTKERPDTHCYTIVHKEFKEDTQDIVIPKLLEEKMGFSYQQIKDLEVSEAIRLHCDKLLGKDCYSQRTLYIAYTILSNYSGATIVNGDLIGQVGKCSLHRNIPEGLASPRYFRCKLHKHSHSSLSFLDSWMNEIRMSGEKVNLFDLFSIENRLGRWAGMENTIYNILGINYVNIFNSRSILYEWTNVYRTERMKSRLHLDYMGIVNPRLTQVPFEMDSNFLIKISKSSWLPFYISTFIKFYYNKFFKQ